MIEFQQSQTLTSHFESFWSIVKWHVVGSNPAWGTNFFSFFAALVNFSEDCPKNILAHYLDAIIAKLEAILSSKFKELVEKGNKMVLEQIVTTLASVADTGMKKHAQM